VNTFTGPVSLACTSGLPSNAICYFSSSTVTAGDAPVNATLTFITGTQNASNIRFGGLGVLACGLFSLGLFGRRRAIAWLCLLVLLPVGIALTGCGGGPETPAGSTNVTITATSRGVTHTQMLKLQVK
jgi:hypothetical protein